MRIALFSDTFYPQVNGVSLTLQRLVQHFEKRNIDYQVFAPDCLQEQHDAHNVYRFTSLPVFRYPEYRIALPNYYSIRQQLHQFKPDMIHMATPFNVGWCGLHYGRKYDIPHVASYHTHFDRYLDYYHLQFVSRLFWRYIRWFHQSCLATYVPSEETKAVLVQQGITDVEMWKRGVDCNLFHPSKRASQSIREQYGFDEPYLFLYVGRVTLEKDLDILLQLSTQLPDELREQIRWIIVGEGPYSAEMRAQAPGNMTFTGYLKGEPLAQMYASADLFIFPSTTETFGNVVLEAMASGTPTIGARAGGVQEIIEDGKTGSLCVPRDTADFSATITRLMSQPLTRSMYGQQGREYALTQSWDAIFDNLISSYEHLIEIHQALNNRSKIQSA